MSHAALKQLVGAAVVDRELCEGLMNGRRTALLTEFDLTEDERDLMVSLEAGTVHDLAVTVHRWLVDHSEPPSPQVDQSAPSGVAGNRG